jgi:predicted PurR-regulated permease PerM
VKAKPSPPFLTRPHIFAFVFFAILVFLLYQMGRILAPFSSALLWAAILTLALYPAYIKVQSLTKGRAGLAAGIMTLAILLLIVGPAIFLFGILAAQAVDLYQWASELIQSGRLAEGWSKFASPILEKILAIPFLADIDVKDSIIKGLREFSSGMASQIGGALKNTLVLVVNLLIMLIALFFLFRDGAAYYAAVMSVLPFSSALQQAITRKFLDTFNAVINGVFLIALLQGVMTGIGFALFGVPFPVLWGFFAAVLALLPVGGAALVWIPGALYLYLAGSTLHGIILAAWGVLLVSLPDNFLKPLLIGRKAKIPSFLLFIGILGGLQVYGFLGIFFGPLVVTLLAAFVQIYREEYADQ